MTSLAPAPVRGGRADTKAQARPEAPSAPNEPRILRATHGRARFCLGNWSGRERRTVETRLRALPGVKSVEANPVTGNALVLFDASATNADALLLGACRVWRELAGQPDSPLQSATGKTRPAPKGQPDPARPPALREPVRPMPTDEEAARPDVKGVQTTSAARGRARIAVRGLDRDPAVARRVEQRLERTPGVKARANPLTGRVLVEFDLHRSELTDIIAQVADIELPELPGEDRPAYPLDPAPLVQSASRTIGAGLGLGALAARQAMGASGPLPGAGAASGVSGVIGIVQGFPALRNGARQLLGRHTADLLFNGANILSLTFAGSPLGLAVSGVEAFGLLSEVLSRRASWKAYREKIEVLPEAREGQPLRLEAGERAPARGLLQDGQGHALGRDGLPKPVGPHSLIEAGERLHGGPFTLVPQAGPSFEPGPRPVPAREGLEQRYSRLLGPVSLGYAALTGVLTLSPARAFEALLLLNPRAALIGGEGANAVSLSRVLRGGVTVVGTRAGRPLRRFDWLLLDGARAVCDGLEIARTVALDGTGDASELLSLAAGVAAASGTPWGGVFPLANRAPAQDGSFDAATDRASALVAGIGYTLGAARREDVPATYRRTSGEYELVLRCEGSPKPLALFAVRPRLAPEARELVETCRGFGVQLALVADEGQPQGVEAITAVAHRLNAQVVRASSQNTSESGAMGAPVAAIRDKQASGDRVAFASDSPDAGAAFAACDLAIGITSGRSRFPARADVLAPDAGALAAIIEAGGRRDLAARDGVGFSLVANAVGLLWGWQGGTGVARASRAVYVAALAALGSAWWRASGGERSHSLLAKVVDPRPEKWAQRSLDDTLRSLDTTEHGLSQERAQERLRTLPPPISAQKSSLLRTFGEQLASPLNGVLLLGGALSFAVGGMIEAALIGATILINSAVGTWQQGQADRAAQALETMSSPQARVLRDGQIRVISSRQVVPGDVMILASGDRVGADARVLEAQSLEVDEAALTGESLPVVKAPDALDDGGRIVLEGSDVTTGAGQAVVVAVGRGTRMGATAAALAASGSEGKSPLDTRLNAMLRQSLPWSIGAGLLIVGSALLRGQTLVSQAALGASVAVSAVPEGLPLLAKMGEAAVAKRLSGHNAFVRRLSAVESLGRVDVACTDKTGTLTQGKLALRVVAGPTEEATLPAPGEEEAVEVAPSLRAVLECAGLASPHPDAPDAASHPTDVSVTQGALRVGLGESLRAPREAESPFDPVRAFHAAQVGGRVCVKGATEAILGRCTRVRRGEEDEPLDETGREALSRRSQELAGRGLRVLMVAQRAVEAGAEAQVSDPRELVALGFVGISDPLRSNVFESVGRCHEAGVRVIMLTGDHPATARAIAREAGLFDWRDPKQPDLPEEKRILTGSDLAELVNGELDAALDRAVVVARATPLDKVRIVESLQRRGHTVAMTGDGVNDAPALRLADVGVAMGQGGTEVARQAADVVLAHDDFSTLVEALVEGRSFWRNIRRALGLLIGGNLGELGLQVGTSLIGLTPPLTTTQVLAVNLITDVLPAVAVALQGPESRNLSSLSREGTAAFDAPLRRDVLRRGGATAIPSIVGYLLALSTGGLAQGRTVAFISIVVTQLAQTLDAGRTEGGLTKPVAGAVAGSLALLGVALVTPGLRELFALAIPTPLSWALIGGGALVSVALSRTLPGPNAASTTRQPKVISKTLLALPAPARAAPQLAAAT